MTTEREPTIGRRPYGRWLLCMTAALVAAQSGQAQSILGTNLIVNGNAEAGTAATGPTKTVPIPGWTPGTGNVVVLPYGLSGFLLDSSPAPQDHTFNYFSAGSGTASSTLTQNIDISSASTLIGAGSVKYTASGFLGAANVGYGTASATMQLDFKNAGGQLFSSVIVKPLSFADRVGLTAQQQIGLVPAGTATITVTLTLTVFCAVGYSDNCSYGAADSLSIVLSTLGTNPASVLGANLLINGNAEAGPSAPNGSLAPYIPGWSTTFGASVAPYGGSGWISASAPGPTDRGTNLFTGIYTLEYANPSMYQDIDVSAAASLIDSGQINYQVSAWLGAVGIGAPTLTYTFFDWSGTQRSPTGQLTVTHSGTSLLSVSNSAELPAGTRRVRIAITFADGDFLADNISFIIGSQTAPFVTPQGVVPVYSTATTVESGSWVSIYGTGLAASTTAWNGNFPTTLAGTSVTIDSNPAYLWFVSPTQINLQVPSDTATGTVPVVVTTAAGSFTTDVTLGQYAPSFSLFNAKYAAAIVPTPGSPGDSGNGYDYIGPGGSGLPFTSRPVKAGETVLLYGVGFGPTTPPVPAGAAYSGVASVPVLPTVTMGGVSATVAFAGIVEAGLYQLNVVVPSAGSGDKALEATIGGVTTPANVFITLQ